MSDTTASSSPSGAEFPLQECAERVRNLAANLCASIGGREGEFLELGASLQDFVARLGDLSGRAHELAELTSGNEIATAIKDLSEELEQMTFVCKLEGNQESLAELDRTIRISQGLEEFRDEFKRIVRSLQMLGISTRIESARLGSNGLGFSTLADDVEKLAANITVSSARIIDKAGELRSLVGTVRESTRAILATQQGCSTDIFQTIRKNIGHLASLTTSSRDFSASLSERTADLSRSIGEIVSSLQFHDIIRQQVEHVENSLEDIRSVITDRAGRETGDVPDGERNLIGWIGDVCALQVSQLENASDRFRGAGEAIRSHLSTVAANAASIGREISQLLDSDRSGTDSGSALASIEEALSAVVRSVSDFSEKGREIGEVMTSVAGTVAEISSFVNDIEEVGSEIELIALNASVKAARTGDEGKALGVLAQAIQRLSGEAQTQTEAVAAVLRDISGASETLQANAETYLDTRLAGEMIARQEGLIHRLRRVAEQVEGLFAAIEEQGNRLALDIDDTVGTVTFHLEVATHLDQAKGELQEIMDRARRVVPYEDDHGRPERLRELLGRYTMEVERLVHLRTFGQGEEVTDLGVELFDDGLQPGGDSEFGDNVELF